MFDAAPCRFTPLQATPSLTIGPPNVPAHTGQHSPAGASSDRPVAKPPGVRPPSPTAGTERATDTRPPELLALTDCARQNVDLRLCPETNRPTPTSALVTEQDLASLIISAHALRRFVQRLQPDIPGADQVAEPMARLEDIGSGRRTGPEQAQLNRYRDWMATHVEPKVRELIRCEGFWTTERPRWSRSDKPSAGYLQIGRMCACPPPRTR